MNNFYKSKKLYSFKIGAFVNVHDPQHFDQIGQIIDIDKRKSKALIKITPKIDYERLRASNFRSQKALNNHQDPNYQIPQAFFRQEEFQSEIKKVKLQISWAKNQCVDAIEWDDDKYVGRFLYKKFPFSAIEVVNVIKRSIFELYKKSLSDFEKQNSEILQSINDYEKDSKTKSDSDSSGIEEEDDIDTSKKQPLKESLPQSDPTNYQTPKNQQQEKVQCIPTKSQKVHTKTQKVQQTIDNYISKGNMNKQSLKNNDINQEQTKQQHIQQLPLNNNESMPFDILNNQSETPIGINLDNNIDNFQNILNNFSLEDLEGMKSAELEFNEKRQNQNINSSASMIDSLIRSKLLNQPFQINDESSLQPEHVNIANNNLINANQVNNDGMLNKMDLFNDTSTTNPNETDKTLPQTNFINNSSPIYDTNKSLTIFNDQQKSEKTNKSNDFLNTERTIPINNQIKSDKTNIFNDQTKPKKINIFNDDSKTEKVNEFFAQLKSKMKEKNWINNNDSTNNESNSLITNPNETDNKDLKHTNNHNIIETDATAFINEYHKQRHEKTPSIQSKINEENLLNKKHHSKLSNHTTNKINSSKNMNIFKSLKLPNEQAQRFNSTPPNIQTNPTKTIKETNPLNLNNQFKSSNHQIMRFNSHPNTNIVKIPAHQPDPVKSMNESSSFKIQNHSRPFKQMNETNEQTFRMSSTMLNHKIKISNIQEKGTKIMNEKNESIMRMGSTPSNIKIQNSKSHSNSNKVINETNEHRIMRMNSTPSNYKSHDSGSDKKTNTTTSIKHSNSNQKSKPTSSKKEVTPLSISNLEATISPLNIENKIPLEFYPREKKKKMKVLDELPGEFQKSAKTKKQSKNKKHNHQETSASDNPSMTHHSSKVSAQPSLEQPEIVKATKSKAELELISSAHIYRNGDAKGEEKRSNKIDIQNDKQEDFQSHKNASLTLKSSRNEFEVVTHNELDNTKHSDPDRERDRRYDLDRERDRRYDSDRERHLDLDRERDRRYDSDRERRLDSDRERDRRYDSDRERRHDSDRERHLDLDRERDRRYDSDRERHSDSDRERDRRYDSDRERRHDSSRERDRRYDSDRDYQRLYDLDRERDRRHDSDRDYRRERNYDLDRDRSYYEDRDYDYRRHRSRH
ncbi:Transcription elongation factor SPT5 [Tritrichomonas musculus]|uniref:Transcription elongation factor SPT5 n=1 Tax=Tritrichomonas musculus TaxID=1915356 RepID=A0ABR2L950_9EUKA